MDRETLLKNLENYRFYQRIDLGDGIVTPGLPTGDKQKQVLKFISSLDLKGKRVVDLGCANGMFAFAAEQCGAAEVMAVDHTKQNIECLRQVIVPHLRSIVEPVEQNILDFTAQEHGQFDVVVYAGLLYHLKYPFWSLRLLRDLVKDGCFAIVETGIFDDFERRALLYCPSPEDSPQKTRGGNTCSLFNEKALIETLQYFGFQVREKVIITKAPRRFAKKVAAKFVSSYYPTSNIVLLCQRDAAAEDKFLTDFYESTTE